MILGEQNEVDYRMFSILQQLIGKEEGNPYTWPNNRLVQIVDTAGEITRLALVERDRIVEERAQLKKEGSDAGK